LFIAQKNTGFVFVESTEDIANDPNVIGSFGQPILISDTTSAKINMQLVISGQAIGDEIAVSLADVFGHKQVLPQGIVQFWRDKITTEDSDDIVINARFIINSQNVEGGTFLQGSEVRKFLGMTWGQALKAKTPGFKKAVGKLSIKSKNYCKKILSKKYKAAKPAKT